MEPSGEQYKQLGEERHLQLQEVDAHNMSLAPDLYYLSDSGSYLTALSLHFFLCKIIIIITTLKIWQWLANGSCPISDSYQF